MYFYLNISEKLYQNSNPFGNQTKAFLQLIYLYSTTVLCFKLKEKYIKAFNE